MRFYALILIVTLFFSACDKGASEGSDLPISTYEMIDADQKTYNLKKQGQKLTLASYEGKVVLIDIFATWCPACKVLTPHLSNLQKKYPKDLLVLGLLIEKDKPHSYVKAYAKEYDAAYPISNCEANFELTSRIAADLRQPRSFPIPLLVMYDSKGNYFRHYVGAVPEEMIERDILSAKGDK